MPGVEIPPHGWRLGGKGKQLLSAEIELLPTATWSWGGGMPGAGEIHSPRAGAGTGGSLVVLVVPIGQSSHIPGPGQCG